MSLVRKNEEPGWGVSEAAARAQLYKGHEIINELVLGPTLLQPPDVAYKFNGLSEMTATVKQEPEAHTDCGMAATIVMDPCVKDEPEWQSDEWNTDCDNQKAKLKLLASLPLPHDNNLNVLQQKIKPKQEQKLQNTVSSTNLKSDIQTDIKTVIDQNSPQRKGKDEPLSKGRLQHNEAKIRSINSESTKPAKALRLRSRLLIRYEEDETDPDSSEEEIKEKPKSKKIHKCDYCGKQFAFRSNLTNHIRIHTGEKPYSCKVCSKKFSDYSVLTRHRRVHTGVKPHACDVCGKSYSEKYLLKNHMRVHSGEKTYFCKDCPKTFINSSNFRRHQKVHLHKYACDICDRKFDEKPRLVSHIQNHMKPRPHVCRFCKKAFSQSGYLNRHLTIHTDTKEIYACGVCNKKFTQHSSLKKHAIRRVCERKKQLLINP